MVIPVVGIQRLRALEVFRGAVGVTCLLKPDGELEAGFGFHLRGGSRLHAARELLVRQHVLALVAVGHPIAQRRHVRLAFDRQRLPAVDVGPRRCPRRLRGTDDAPLLVDPDAHRHVDELKHRADGVLGVDELRERRPGRVVPLAGRGFAADVLRRRDDFEVLILQLTVDLLPAWQIESASSPGGPRDHQGLFAAEAGQMHRAAQPIEDFEIRRDTRIREPAA